MTSASIPKKPPQCEAVSGGTKMIAFANPIEALETSARERLAPMWRNAGRKVEVSYPVSTDQVLAMLRACDYRATMEGIVQLVSEGAILVPVVAGRPRWAATDVLNLVGHLEHRRAWKWPSRFHAWKFSQLERLQAEAETAGKSTCFDDLHRFDIESLLRLQVEAEKPSTREALGTVILAKLKSHAS
jgi:hypothetical protein